MKKLASVLGFRQQVDRRARLRLKAARTAIYAVGDVHGCLEPLLALERNIVNDAKALPGRKLIIMLGDYVDRGPASAQVIDHLLAPPPAGFDRICLAGNHEVAMQDYILGRIALSEWMGIGAATTVMSYGVDPGRLREIFGSNRRVDSMIRKAIPAEHLGFLRSLPILVDASRYLFVHAGIRPGVDIDIQTDEDLVLIRSPFFEGAHLLDRYVVHGHTPVATARREGKRINLDTGVCFSGRLTALRIWQDKGRYLTN